jgi:L-amino acid N-acyltransferase YncA
MHPQTTAIVRPSVDADMTAITRIYAHHVLNGTGTFETSPPAEADMRTRRADVLGKNLPWLVIETNGYIAGFAYANWFKPRPAYRFSVEDSIYMAQEATGKGLGKQLMNELLVQLERRGVRKVMAVIGDSANVGSIGLHRSAGFEQGWRDSVLRLEVWPLAGHCADAKKPLAKVTAHRLTAPTEAVSSRGVSLTSRCRPHALTLKPATTSKRST